MPYPTFTVCPPLRCCFPVNHPSRDLCGEIARWMSSEKDPVVPAFYCDKHKFSNDVPIAGEQLVQRLTLHVDVLFTGVTLAGPRAREEAIERLQAVVAAAGGLLNLHSLSSETGYAAVQPAGEAGKGERGRG
jgi:hypothetical protein